MMPLSNLLKMVFRNTVRSPKHFVLSAFGIVIGIGSFVFFLGLSLGVRNVILGKIFPLDVVQVIAPHTSVGGVDLTDPLDDADVALLKSHPDVADALPRMRVSFPAIGFGSFEGEEIKFEVGGFTDGIDPSHLIGNEKLETLFRDWEAEEPNPPACVPLPDRKNPCADKTYHYCDVTTRTCKRRVPVIISPAVLEIYNSQVASAHGLPVIGDMEMFLVDRGAERLRFTIGLGDTMVAGGGKMRIADDRRREVEAQLVGISDKAMPLGMTIPIQYVRRWNQEFAGDEAARTYSSIIVKLKDKDRLAPFSAWLEEHNLRLEDSLGERFATAIFIVTTLFVFISFVIVTISSINIAHNFFMQVSERRREIGVLRAVGATRTDVKLIILGEAALIGVIGGVLGIVIAIAGAGVVDWASSQYLPRFPFKPKTYFDFEPWIIGLGLAFSTVFCVVGGYLPARKASGIAPAQALAQT
jgi:putative ABC transport system permease protein